MIEAWVIAICVGFAGYAFLLANIIQGLVRLGKSPATAAEGLPAVTVVIAARNEQDYISRTLESLLNQDYPRERFDVIVVDDRSTDGTGDIVSEFSGRDARVSLLHQKDDRVLHSPKKQALELGIRSASGEVILTTDADCRHPRGWLRAIAGAFKSDVGMVVGQARFETNRDAPLWQRLQALDYQALGYASAGLVASNMPFSCTGASLGFRLALFDEVGGWLGVDHLISGDDELLLAKAHSSRWKVVSVSGADGVAQTRPPASLGELIQQRIRWGSKGLYYSLPRRLLLIIIFLFYFALTTAPIVWLFGGLTAVWLSFIMAKLLLDYWALTLGATRFGERISALEFFILEVIHPLSIIMLAAAGHLFSFEWKGQRFRGKGKKSL